MEGHRTEGGQRRRVSLGGLQDWGQEASWRPVSHMNAG